MLDLAIPRDFEPAIGECLGVYLYSIDDLRRGLRSQPGGARRRVARRASIIEDETARFMADLHHRATGPIIKRLKQGWQQPKKTSCAACSTSCRSSTIGRGTRSRQAFDRLVNKLLHPPLETLRDEAQHGIPHALVDAFKRLFQLKD